ncbi:efflux transporter outer membrane subunit [Bombella sp. ESL0385]|uniref:efflux transporter outer membrane subunit n=1 Tax=Bombella sp. ESL0385 TaxID=2676446 RepID=UPI0012D9A268|nr:efflux transporter outer membrane subunit [Bombella sp. ESL0385]MUG90618.1 efflux transporter outer membrane subunit [Bombella sp. ESL0385]
MAGRLWGRVSLVIGGLSLCLTSCDLAPHYHTPHFIYPDGWAGKGIMGDAQPADAIERGQWWTLFHDPQLDDLEKRLEAYNPDLQAAAEVFTQERDIARETESRLYPQLAGGAQMSRNKQSEGRLFLRRSNNTPIYESNVAYSGAATWEPDFWDAIRNQSHMQKNLAQAGAAQYALTRLSLQAELASNYVTLRGIDAQLAVYDDSIRYFRTAVEITRLRQGGAIGAGLDVSRAENQLYDAEAAKSDLMAARQIEEHAIAVMVNMVPASFHIEPIKDIRMHFGTIRVQSGLPSTLLERRPDVAVSERQMAAAARAIGVSRAAFYPHIVISATGGFEDSGFDLASISRAFWQIAVQAVEPLFTGGMRRAALQRAWSQYRERVDAYRATVLGAFQDVEDGLSETGLYHQEQLQQHQAVEAALRTQAMTMALYTGGLSNYLDALVAQQDALKARLLEVQAQMKQVQATVRLIRALGGGWSDKLLPDIKSIDPIGPLQYKGLHHARPAGEVPVGVAQHGSEIEPPLAERDFTGAPHETTHP